MADDRELERELRQLPPLGQPPDWSALQRSIDQAVAELEPPRRRRWWPRLVVPGLAIAAAATVAIIVVQPKPSIDDGSLHATVVDARPPEDPPVREPSPASAPISIAGVDIGGPLSEAATVDLLDDPFFDLDTDSWSPASDLAWVDDLDDDQLESLERLLAEEHT